jgi:hypothetical protein
MAEQVWALCDEHGVVQQTIVADEAFIDQLPDLIAADDVDSGELVANGAYDVTDADPRPAIGWRRLHGAWTPPTTLDVDVEQLGPGGKARFTFTDHRVTPVPTQQIRVAGVTVDRELKLGADNRATFTLRHDDLPARPDDLPAEAPWPVTVEVGGAHAFVDVTG